MLILIFLATIYFYQPFIQYSKNMIDKTGIPYFIHTLKKYVYRSQKKSLKIPNG